MSQTKVCVTGAAGYIGSWIVKQLLDKGYIVHATVRNPKDPKNAHLNKNTMSPNSTGELKIFAADLEQPESFDLALQDCNILIHSASPFILTEKPKDPVKELINPAVNGTKNILQSVNRTKSIKHVVLTSSITAVTSYSDAVKVFDENDWNEQTTLEENPYDLSKKLAEEVAWEIAKQTDQWQLTTILPGLVLGPAINAKQNFGSIDIMQKIMDGRYLLGFNICLPIVDVRDVAAAHILAFENFEVSKGQRYLCVNECLFFMQMVAYLQPKYGKTHRLPVANAPKWLLYLTTKFHPIPVSVIKYSIGVPMMVNNKKIVHDLGLQFHPINDTLIEMADSLVNLGLVKPKYCKICQWF